MEEERRPEDYFYEEDNRTEEFYKQEQKELEKVKEYRLYCFSRPEMMNIGRRLVEQDPDSTAVVSITSSTDLLPDLCELGFTAYDMTTGAMRIVPNAIRLKFDDIGPIEQPKEGVPMAMNEKQANIIVWWIDEQINRGIKNFYVHCDAGQSRSQAIVQFILDYLPEYPWKIRKSNPPLTPNRHVLALLNNVIWKRKYGENYKH